MQLSFKRLLLSVMVLYGFHSIQAQQNVGIGTKTPNANAVLELVSPDSNQGFLIPRITTSQRTSMSELSSEDNSLLVFDIDEAAFYFWLEDHWESISTEQLIAGSGISLQDGTIENTGDLSADNEIQDLQLEGNVLIITLNDGATEIDLSTYLDNTDEQSLSFEGAELSISNANSVDLSALSDGTGTDDQTLAEVLSEGADASGITLSNLGSPTQDDDAATKLYVDEEISAIDTDDADADPSNELQDLDLSGNILTITGLASPTEINLAPYAGTNTDEQSLSLSGSDLSITGGNTIDISSIDTDEQGLSDVLTVENDAGGSKITNLGTPTIASDAATKDYVDLEVSSVDTDDADADPSNELQDLDLTDDVLTITGVASPTEIDLSPYAVTNTDEQSLSLSGSDLSITGGNTIDISSIDTDEQGLSDVLTVENDAGGSKITNLGAPTIASDAATMDYVDTQLAALDVSDGDSDDTNEIQTISKSGSTVSLSNGGGSFTDAVDDADASTSNELQTLSQSGNSVTLSDGGGTISIADGDSDNTNEFQTISKSENTVTLSNGGGSFTDEVDDEDASPSNELQTLSQSGNSVTLSDGGGTISVADGDSDNTNEFQTISKSGNTVTLSNGGGSFTDAVDDADASVTNEIQDLVITGGVLSIEGGSTTVNLNTLLDNTDDQGLSISDNNLILEDGGSVSLSDYLDNTDNQSLSLSSNNLSISGGNSVSLADYTKLTEAQVDAYADDNGYLTSVPSRTDFLVISPDDFKALQPASASVDFGVGIGISAEESNGPYAYLTVTEQTTGDMVAGISIPHGASIKEINTLIVNNSNTTATLSIYKQLYLLGEKPNEVSGTAITTNAYTGLKEYSITTDLLLNTDPKDEQGGIYYLYFNSLGTTSKSPDAAIFRVMVTYTY
jgi:hypothetical protein